MLLLTLFLAAAGTISALPLEKRAISATLFAQGQLYNQYSAASYCPSNDGTVGHDLSCVTGNCPLVQTANTSVYLALPGSPNTDTAGFLSLDYTNQLIVLSFRGSESTKNDIVDISFTLRSYSRCSGCKIASGFYSAWQDVASQATSAVTSAMAANPGWPVVVTGHSLGGALATIAAAELRAGGLSVDMYTYGSPRVGNQATAAWISGQAPAQGANMRFTHAGDPTPYLPPLSFGFRNVSPGYHITSATGTFPTPGDIVVQDGDSVENAVGGSSEDQYEAHVWYYNATTLCYTAETS
ncbi:alpha/beta-hydrolase [Trichodelitschia bisporula]|uniref:Alpha/beta-hydrolase n=1 Tax=Trichodelitschia bisporula TaxID=703511 RepID=A0A6G1HQT8_9PEZI|nr:alpha/beta-hydrolase [Trichodelitschia bisporula]